MSNLVNAVNNNRDFQGRIDPQVDSTLPPVTATPAIAAIGVTAAKVAGAVIGAGAVGSAGYAAYRAVAK